MNAWGIFSAIIFVCALVAHGIFRLWQGGFAGKNYMRNEYGIDEEDTDDKNIDEDKRK